MKQSLRQQEQNHDSKCKNIFLSTGRKQCNKRFLYIQVFYICVSLWAWWEVVAAHHWVHDYACCHLQADCLESGISSGPLCSITSMGNLYLYLYILVQNFTTFLYSNTGTLFHPTFTILLIRVHTENDSRMYFLIVLTTDYCWRSWTSCIAAPYKSRVD